jgi:hypothetical protein
VLWLYGQGFPKHKSKLKPAWEPIILARKPAPRVTPLNIDACRLEYEGEADRASATPQGRVTSKDSGAIAATPDAGRGVSRVEFARPPLLGRWPANVVLDEEAAAMLDEQTGDLSPGNHPAVRNVPSTFTAHAQGTTPASWRTEGGGASRFFYTAKASRSEREAGLQDLPSKPGGSNAKGFTDDVAAGQDRNRPVKNYHPTVKPIALMRWLIRLITPEGGTVLDPFMGSGTTGCAAALEGRGFIGIDIDAEYVAIAERRIAYWAKKAA